MIPKTLMAAAAVIALSLPVTISVAAENTAAETGKMTTSPKNEMDFRASIAGPGTLSLMTSKIAQDKATNAEVREFAQFEVDEQQTISKILKELKTPDPVLTDEDKAVLEKLKNTEKGAAFDEAYLQAQHDTHQKLEKITGNFVNNSEMGDNPAENEARHIAMLAHSTIKSHVIMSKKMLGMIKK
jgi:predicted outer membrane protein